jgi:hypothetical protein
MLELATMARPIRAAHKVLHVLSDGGNAQIVFAGAFGKAEEEVCRVFVLHELPSLVDDQDAAFLVCSYVLFQM